MKSKTVDVYSDSSRYWWRWGAVYFSLAMFYWLGIFTFGEAPAASFHGLLAAIAVLSLILAFIFRPKSFQIEVTDDELRILRVPSGSIKRAFKANDVRYVTIRQNGYLFGMSVLNCIVRTKRHGSVFFGPVYIDGVDGVTSSKIAQLLPRISREGLIPAQEPEKS